MNKQAVRKKHLVMAAALCCCLPVLAAGKAAESPTHPEIDADKMYVDCAECHLEATPDLHKEWFASKHGLAMVKCYQCHGTFETFRLTPVPGDCAACHQDMTEKYPKDKQCWACHLPHSFQLQR